MTKPGPPTLFIYRGLPGSGKTTRANEHGCLVISSRDMYSMVGGEYQYDLRIGKEEPAPCRPRIKAWAHGIIAQTLNIGADVAVAETLVKREMVQVYIDLARACHANFKVIDCFISAADSHKRNTHNVPVEVINDLAENFEPWVS